MSTTALLVILLALSATAAASGACLDTCVNNNQCVGSACTRCSNGTCTEGLPCGSRCQVDTDCYSDGSCTLCYFQRCASPHCGAACQSNADCSAFSGCTECVNDACSPPVTSAPATPSPPTPAPTTPHTSAAFGALACGSHNNCQNWAVYEEAYTLQEAQDFAIEFCDTGSDCDLITMFGEPLPCFALAVTPGGGFGWSTGEDLGTATTQAMSECKKHNTNCYVVSSLCAALPPADAVWGALSCSQSGCSTSWGITSNDTASASREAAIKSATKACSQDGQHTCHAISVFYDCVALALSGGGSTSSSSTATTRAAAEAHALADCSFSSGETCTIATSSCVPGFDERRALQMTAGVPIIRGSSSRRDVALMKH